MIASAEVFAMRAYRRRCAAGSNDDRDNIDLDLEKVEVARHLAQFLTLAGNLLRDVDGHVALGDPARTADEHFGFDPLQARPMCIAREFPFHELSPGFDI